MAKLNVNVGSSDNAGNGDTLRAAFIKINSNFTELYAAIGADVQIPSQINNGGKYLYTNGTTLSWATVVGGSGGTSVTASDTAPSVPTVGSLWYDIVGGRMYVYYDSNWVDTNPMANETINLTTLKSVVAASTSFTDFQTRIAAL